MIPAQTIGNNAEQCNGRRCGSFQSVHAATLFLAVAGDVARIAHDTPPLTNSP